MDIGTFSGTHYDEYSQTGDLNLFERVIDSLMVEKYSNDREISEYIESLSREDKRIAILSLLDGDNGMWVKLKSLIKGNELTKMDHIKDVILMLRDFVKVGEVEKKKFGEVMSPLELVKEMISTLPEEVWSNPNLKWLDPANGTGPYPLMVIYKLMKGLEDWEPDPNKRYKHIVENMIYTCELQARNVFLWLCAVDPHDEYKTNTYWGSFLDEGFDKHMKEVWGVDRFEIILGNPPYNDGSGNIGRGHSLWTKFINKSLPMISDFGYLLFVTPSLWRNVKNEQLNIMKRYQIRYLEMHDERDGIKTFGANTRYDIYLVEKKEYSEKTKIKDQNGKMLEIDVRNWEFIPNCMFQEIEKMCFGEDKCQILYNRSSYPHYAKYITKEKTNENIYPIVYSVNKQNMPKILYSNTNDRGHFGLPKIIWGSGATGFFIDYKGEFGMTQWCSALVIENKDDAEDILKYLKSNDFSMIIKAISVSKAEVNHKIMKCFNKNFWKNDRL